jgi:phosphorylated CTD-interacting factor 1
MGHGMQCALAEHVFDTLHKYVQVNFECFASPLNCRFPTFCSAFPDTDGPFGSHGSFFNFFPLTGSYEVNPPFIESIMTAAVQHVHLLLNKSSQSLSFVLIIPGTNFLFELR